MLDVELDMSTDELELLVVDTGTPEDVLDEIALLIDELGLLVVLYVVEAGLEADATLLALELLGAEEDGDELLDDDVVEAADELDKEDVEVISDYQRLVSFHLRT